MRDYRLTLEDKVVQYRGVSPRDAVLRYFNSELGIRVNIQQAFGSVCNCKVQLISSKVRKINYYNINSNNKILIRVDKLNNSNRHMIELLDKYSKAEKGCTAKLLDNNDMYGLTLGTKLIGCCSISDTYAFTNEFGSKRVGYLSNLFIMKSFRGKNFGGYLVRSVLDLNKDKYDVICATCVYDWEIKFFKDRGFNRYDECLMYKEV